MKTNDVDFVFPVLAFMPDNEVWGFKDINTLTSCGPRTLKDNSQVGLELIDARGHRWIVRSFRRVGPAESFVRSVFTALLTARPQSRIEHELEAVEPVVLAQVQDRACASLEAFAQDYCLEDERDTVLAALIADVKLTKQIAEIYELLGPDTFQSY